MKKILLVEDDADLAALVTYNLEKKATASLRRKPEETYRSDAGG
jgi:hypothetical protein